MKILRKNLFLVVLVLFIPLAVGFWSFKVDDAYISFVYAKNLVQGNGLTYNGTVVEGYSNFLWTVLIAPFIALKIDPLLAARLLSLFSAGATLAILEKLMRTIFPNAGTGVLLLGLASAAVLAPFTAWTMGGLETIFFTLLVTLFVYLEVKARPSGAYFSAATVLLAALTRPEGAMLFPIFLVNRLLVKPRTRADLLGPSLLVVLMLGLFLGWRKTTYGYLLPNTAYLKLHPDLETARIALAWLFSFIQLRPFFILVGLIAVFELLATGQGWQPPWRVIFLTMAAFIFFVLYSGRDWMPHFRFLTPVVPLAGLFVVQLLEAASSSRIRLILAILPLIAISTEIIVTLIAFIPSAPALGDYTDGLVRGGKWLKAQLRPEETIAVVDAGALAYYSELKTIDILGLNDTHIAHSPLKSDPAYVLSFRPAFIQLHLQFTPSGELVQPDTQDHLMDLGKNESFLQDYQPYLGSLDDPYFPLFFQRKVN